MCKLAPSNALAAALVVPLALLSLRANAEIIMPAPRANSNKIDFELPVNQQLQEIRELQKRFKAGSKNLLSFEEAVKIGIANNPTLSIAEARIEEKFWQLTGNRRQWYPTIAFETSNPVFGRYNSTSNFSQYNKNPRNNPPKYYKELSQYYTFAPSLLISWTFFDLPREGNIKASFYDLKSEQYLYGVALRDLILSIQQYYFKVQSAAKLIESYTKIYEINKKQVEILEARYSRDIIDLGTLAQAQSQYFQNLGQLIGYYNQYFNAAAELSYAIGMRNYEDFVPATELKQTGQWDKSLEETIQIATEQREEILSSLALAEKDDWTAFAQNGEYFPTFSIGALGTMSIYNGLNSWPTYAEDQKNFYNYDETMFASTLGLNFTWSVFDGGVAAASAKAYQAQAESERQTAVQNQEQAAQQVKSAYYQYETAAKEIIVAKKAVDTAKTSQTVASMRFDIGLGDITTVVQTIQLYGQVNQQYVDALLNYNTAVAELYRYSAIFPPSVETEADTTYDAAVDGRSK